MEPVKAVLFVTQSVRRALVLAPLAAAVGEGAEVLQQGHAPKATLRRGLVPVQAPAGVQHALQSVHEAIHHVAMRWQPGCE